LSRWGIARTEWERGRDGDVLAASGLRITLRDLARIGLMVLDGGRWHGRQVVPAQWLAASFAPAVSMPDGRRLLPRLGLVVAITAGNYDAPDQWRPPTAVLRDVLLPALRER
jgi:CubicO group peptidase (beta-lactamase class C family)